jgi:NADPH:quinone reductase
VSEMNGPISVLNPPVEHAARVAVVGPRRTQRIVVDRYGGPEVLRLVEEDTPRPGPGEVRIRVLAAGVSFTDALIRAGTYLGGPKPPFTPGYEFVGVVEELGPGCSRLREGVRVGALTQWGGYAETVCLPEVDPVEVPEDLDPADVVSLIFPYMTAYQMLHRTAEVRPGETVLVHGAAGRVGTAVLELAAVAGVRVFGTASARDRAAVERLGGVAIDYRNEDFVARVRELTADGVDVALDGIGGMQLLRSFRALRRGDPLIGDAGGRLVLYGNQNTLANGRKSWRGWAAWYPATAAVWLWAMASPGRRVLAYRIQKLRPRHRDWFRDDLQRLLQLLREGKLHPVVTERLPLSEARRAHEMLESSASKGRIVLVP